MKIIDAHIHFVPHEGFDRLAVQSGHENTEEHLRQQYRRHGIVHAVVMGNRSLQLSDHEYPPFMSYCIGLDRVVLGGADLREQIDLVEQHLRRPACVGIKLYPGYNPAPVSDPDYFPYYELALRYAKPVAIHTGATASGMGRLRHSHPLHVDDVATLFPAVQFVMCHFGNPYLVDAAAVMSKNQNVAADLSGMLEGQLDMPRFREERADYIDYLKLWTGYTGAWDRLLYGTDWPLVNLSNYLEFVQAIIPERYLQGVLFDNANRLYGLGL